MYDIFVGLLYFNVFSFMHFSSKIYFSSKTFFFFFFFPAVGLVASCAVPAVISVFCHLMTTNGTHPATTSSSGTFLRLPHLS